MWMRRLSRPCPAGTPSLTAGIEPSDIIHAITAATGLDGEAVRNVRVLERFSLVEVPEQQAQRVVELVSGTEIRGQPLRLERANS